MNHVRKFSLWAALVLAGGAWLAGCSSLPSGPGSNAYPDPQLVRVDAPPAGTFHGRGGGSPEPLSSSKDIDGDKGGSLTVGRFTVDVPRGAYTGSATITIGVADPSVLKCDLKVTPNSANGFSVPVTLTTDWSLTNVTDPTSLVEVWYDEAAGVWRQCLGSSVDLVKLTVFAPLSHFSTYGVLESKAGW